MAEALELGPGDRVLEIGTGSGYAAAVLGRVAGEVCTDRAPLRRSPTRPAAGWPPLGYDNIYVLHGDGTLGWPSRPVRRDRRRRRRPAVPQALRRAARGSAVGWSSPSAPDRGPQHLVRVTARRR